MAIITILAKYWKAIAVAALLIATFFAGWHVKSKFDQAAMATAIQKAVKAQESLAKKEAPVIAKNAATKTVIITKYKTITQKIAKAPNKSLDAKAPQSFIDLWNVGGK